MNRDVFWEYYCNLFKTNNDQQEICPYTWRCSCGHTWKFNKIQLMLMFFKGNYIYTCPQCLKQSNYRMITHVVREIDTEKIREHNRGLE